MPLFEYKCDDCCTEFEELEAFDDRDVPHECPSCGSKKSARQLSVFSSPGGPGSSCAATSCSTCKPAPTST